jgi:hypothetical protein
MLCVAIDWHLVLIGNYMNSIVIAMSNLSWMTRLEVKLRNLALQLRKQKGKQKGAISLNFSPFTMLRAWASTTLPAPRSFTGFGNTGDFSFFCIK